MIPSKIKLLFWLSLIMIGFTLKIMIDEGLIHPLVLLIGVIVVIILLFKKRFVLLFFRGVG
ncbi:MAG: hypothetical protein ACFE8J_08760 [Candidatus Heimdallarchaeota archaeon]